jgi:hypothetical protein
MFPKNKFLNLKHFLKMIKFREVKGLKEILKQALRVVTKVKLRAPLHPIKIYYLFMIRNQPFV